MGEYTHPPLEGNYTVSYNEDQGGMEVIYDITNIFLDAVIKPNLFPDNFLKDNFPDLDSITNAGGEVFVENIQEIIVQNIPLLICIILGPLMALATLLCGFCFCCCQLSAHYDLHTVENEAQMTSKVPFFPAPLDFAKVQFLGVGVKCSPAECISENRKIFPNDSIVVFR